MGHGTQATLTITEQLQNITELEIVDLTKFFQLILSSKAQ
jgi:hypothetical protein